MPASSPSPPQETSNRCRAILNLGKQLAAELDDERNTLARWMAHYISRLIIEAEEDQSEQGVAKRALAAETILRLWKQCSHFPDGHRPLEDFEPVLRTMNSLDPESPRQRYDRIWSPRSAKGSADESESQRWLRAAASVDNVAVILIRAFLRQAVHNANDKSREWVRLADEASIGQDELASIVRIFLDGNGGREVPDADDKSRERTQQDIEKLEAFARAAANLAQALREQLADGTFPKMEIPSDLDDGGI